MKSFHLNESNGGQQSKLFRSHCKARQREVDRDRELAPGLLLDGAPKNFNPMLNVPIIDSLDLPELTP